MTPANSLRRSGVAALALCVCLVSTSANAAKPGSGGGNTPSPAWEYRPDLGGWLDWNTGLVWGQNAYDFFYEMDPESYMMGNWHFANEVVIPEYCFWTGFDDWRLPTRAEVSDATRHRYVDFVLDGYVSYTNPYRTWTSEGNGVWRFSGDLRTGESTKTLHEGSTVNTVPVRRAFP